MDCHIYHDDNILALVYSLMATADHSLQHNSLPNHRNKSVQYSAIIVHTEHDDLLELRVGFPIIRGEKSQIMRELDLIFLQENVKTKLGSLK